MAISGRDLPSTKETCDALVREGSLVRKKEKKRQQLVIAESERAQFLDTLFDPAALITHHVSRSEWRDELH